MTRPVYVLLIALFELAILDPSPYTQMDDTNGDGMGRPGIVVMQPIESSTD